MKALVLEEYNRLVYKDMPEPLVGKGEVRIAVKACGICGSDVHGMDGSSGRRRPPLIMGHEASGVIESTGPGATAWDIGDRVTFDSTIFHLDDWYTLRGLYNLSDDRRVLGVAPEEYRQHGAFAEFVVVPQHILYRLPENVSFEHAAMVEPFAVSAHAVNLTEMSYGDSVLVVGTGLIGLCLIQLLRRSNASTIIAIDIDEQRRSMAKDFGTDLSMDARDPELGKMILEATDGRGVDCAFEVVGLSQTVGLAVEHTRRGGSVTLIGNLSQRIDFPLQSVVTRQIRLQGSCAIRGEYPVVLDLMSKGALNPDPLISIVAPLEEGAQWFEKLYTGSKGLNKVILSP